jgi:molecular chaperone GrpE
MNSKDTNTEKADEGSPTGAPAETEALVGATLNPEQVEDLKQRASKADENWDRLLRVTADLDNYKKRAAREKQEAIKYANESLMEKLIPVLDNFDMALAAAQNGATDASDSFRAGVDMIQQQLKRTLAENGLEEVDATGKPFDPTLHHAVEQAVTTEVAEGQVVRQLRKGYKLRDRLLRPASVVVSTAPQAAS